MVGLSTFVGFSLISLLMVFNPSYLAFGLLYLWYFINSGQMFIGLILSFFIGLTFYLIIKFIIRKEIAKSKLVWVVFFASGVAFIIGFFTFFPTKTFVMERDFGKEKIWRVDTNGDKKIDKWVHDNVYDKLLEIDYDTNSDGKPDIWEYYKDNKVIRKEIDTDFDGKVDKVEKY